MQEKKLPSQMKVSFLEKGGQPMVVKQIPIPQLEQGQVLIKVGSASINQVDHVYIKGYVPLKKTPSVPGFEGSGKIVDAKGNEEKSYIGRNVSFITFDGNTGSYGEYCIATLDNVIPLPDNISYQQAASGYINPMTVLSFLRLSKEKKSQAVINTAGASQVGRQMLKLFHSNGYEVISIVRKKEQEDIIKKLGGKYVLNSTDSNFEEELKKSIEILGVKVAFDAVGGELGSQIFAALPADSELIIYGQLSQSVVSGHPIEFLANNKKISGFNVFPYLQKLKREEKLGMASEVAKLLSSDLGSTISKVFSFEQANEAIEYYMGNMTAGKVLIQRQI